MPTNVPDIPRCLELIDDFSMWENIRRHSFTVARVALTLHQGLAAADRDLPRQELVTAGALLHDIAKSKCIEEGCRHAETGAALCDSLGYPQLAEIVATHVFLPGFDVERHNRGEFTAAELVYYADKRVLHDNIVSLDERLDYILEKYGAGNLLKESVIKKNFVQCQQLENQLFSHLQFTSDEIASLVRQKDWTESNLHHYPSLGN